MLTKLPVSARNLFCLYKMQFDFVQNSGIIIAPVQLHLISQHGKTRKHTNSVLGT